MPSFIVAQIQIFRNSFLFGQFERVEPIDRIDGGVPQRLISDARIVEQGEYFLPFQTSPPINSQVKNAVTISSIMPVPIHFSPNASILASL